MENCFLNFFGNYSNTRILEFLITGREFDYSLTDIAKNSGVGWTTLHRVFPRFEKQQIIVKTREIGRAKLFKLNKKNVEVKMLVSLYDSLLQKQLEKFKEKQAQTIKAQR